MKILVLDKLLRQTKKKNMSTEVVCKINSEFEQLKALQNEGCNDLYAYLKSQNGKKLKGGRLKEEKLNETKHIFKYRLSNGDRILYTYGKYLDYIRETENDSLVLIAYAKHDDQASEGNASKNQPYWELDELGQITEEDINELIVDEVEEIVEVLDRNYIQRQGFYVVDGEDFIEGTIDGKEAKGRDISELEVYLSKEQYAYMNQYEADPRPTLLFGGAGTGKTVMLVHMMNNFNLNHMEKRCIYLTQAQPLLDKAKKQFEYLSREYLDYNQIEYKDINKFCLEHLSLKTTNFVQSYQFYKYLEEDKELLKKLERKQISKEDLWAEIRGTIKGGLDEHWKRNKAIKQSDFKGHVIKELECKKYIKRLSEKSQFFMLVNTLTTIDERYKTDSLSKDSMLAIEEILAYYSEIDSTLHMMEKQSYLDKAAENTTLEKETREMVYEIAEGYEKWLGTERYDDNDLVCKLLDQKPASIEKYDFIIVDEVQDYTELQIYLIHKLLKENGRIVFAGDTQQIIHPTIFSERRLMGLYPELAVFNLNENFRCQTNIVELGNCIKGMRNRYIGKKKGDHIELGYRQGNQVMRLEDTTENVTQLVFDLQQYPDVAILVANDMEKEALIHRVGKSEYEKNEIDIIKTVADIKGMEYRYVVCYNIIGYFKEIWEQIIRDQAAGKRTKYQYYFNLFYVAISRAREFLCIMDHQRTKEFEQELETTCRYSMTYLPTFNQEKLQLHHLNNEASDWIANGRKLEQQGLYEDAKKSYIKGMASQEDLIRCDRGIAIQNREFEQVLRLSLQLEDYETAADYMKEVDGDLPLCRLVEIAKDPTIFKKSNQFTAISIIELIQTAFCNEDMMMKNQIMMNFLHVLDREFENRRTNIINRR